MGRIKSALEIALEKTESVKGDRDSISHHEARQTGKRLANSFLGSDDVSLEAEINKAPKEEQGFIRQGVFDVLLSQINLPLSREDEKRVAKAAAGLSILINKNQFKEINGQFTQLISHYLEEAEQFEQAIVQQYTPKLRQKEEELFRRTGQRIRLDPFQDPEFVAFFNQNVNVLRDKYQSVIDQVREQANEFFASP